MSKLNKKAGVLAVTLLFSIGVSGCDMITSIKEYFAKPKPQQASSTAPAQVKQPSTPKPLGKNVLARVGKWTITTEEFNDRLEALKEIVPDYDTTDPQARKLVLDELVRQQLLVEDAQRSGLANEKDIVAAVQEFRRTLIVRETARRITQEIEVTDAEAREFYEEKKDLLIEAGQWHVRQIVVDTKLKASELYTEILKGADFGEMAQMHSIADNATEGGDLGFITDVPFAEMAPVLLELGEGETSNVFEGPDGYYLIKLEEKKGGNQIPYEDIKEEIVQNRTLFKQQQAILEYITKLQQEIPVEVNENNLE